MASPPIPQALSDEITSVNAIYPSSITPTATALTYTLTLPSEAAHTSLVLNFPLDYPTTAPTITGPHSTSATAPKGAANEFVAVARDTLTNLFDPDEPCIYDLIEELLATLPAQAAPEPHRTPPPPAPSPPSQPDITLSPAPDWTLSAPITEKKSIFIARAAPAKSPEAASHAVQHLLATDKRAAKATHNIRAWRIHGASEGVVYQDCDDDGESAAGGRLLKLLQMMDAWDVVVVVSRWYGGVHLGPDRFRIINAVAREAVVKAGLEGRKK